MNDTPSPVSSSHCARARPSRRRARHNSKSAPRPARKESLTRPQPPNFSIGRNGSRLSNARATLDAAATKERLAVEQLHRIDLPRMRLTPAMPINGFVAAQADDGGACGSSGPPRGGSHPNARTQAERRAAITVPPAGAIGPMRRVGTDLAAARGALKVGLVVTVTPNRPIGDQRWQTDGTAAGPGGPNGAALGEGAARNAAVDLDRRGRKLCASGGGLRQAQQNVASAGGALEPRGRTASGSG